MEGGYQCSRSNKRRGKRIEEIMKLEDSIRDIAHALLTRVLDKGARDNTTIILCEVRADNRPFKTWLLQKKG